MTHLHPPGGEAGGIPARRVNPEAATRTGPRPAGRERAALRELKLTCMDNLLSAAEERVDFKDLGHDAGDLVLAEAGRRLSALARRTDTVARLGGDEFVIVCGEPGTGTDVHLIGDRIIRALAGPYLQNGRDLSVTCSVGIAVGSDPGAAPGQLIRDADTAMYEAKKAGRNRYRVSNPARRARAGSSLLHSDLCRAIEHSELFLVYQPAFSLETQLLTGAEALAPPRPRDHPARRVHPLRRKPRADRADRLVRLGPGLPPAR